MMMVKARSNAGREMDSENLPFAGNEHRAPDGGIGQLHPLHDMGCQNRQDRQLNARKAEVAERDVAADGELVVKTVRGEYR